MSYAKGGSLKAYLDDVLCDVLFQKVEDFFFFRPRVSDLGRDQKAAWVQDRARLPGPRISYCAKHSRDPLQPSESGDDRLYSQDQSNPVWNGNGSVPSGIALWT